MCIRIVVCSWGSIDVVGGFDIVVVVVIVVVERFCMRKTSLKTHAGMLRLSTKCR